MAYKLEKPYSTQQRADFIVEYNHRLGLRIEEIDTALVALEKNEYIENGIVKINPNYEQELVRERQNLFEKEFFQTSLGWIRRKVNMKDGSKKDFLSDLLLQIKAGLEIGQEVQIITYKLPDFSNEISEEYMVSLQERKNATPEFVAECLTQTVLDFGG